MEIDDLKERYRQVAAPGGGDRPQGDHALNGLIDRLKALDAADLRILRRSFVFFAVAGVFYLALFVLTFIAPPDDRPEYHRVVLGLIAFALTLIGFRIRQKVRELTAVDYGEPVLEFLRKAERRIRFVRVEDLVYVIPLSLVLAVAATLGFMAAAERYFPSLDRIVAVEIMAVIVAWGAAVGWMMRRKQWRQRLPVVEEARRLLVMFEQEENGGAG